MQSPRQSHTDKDNMIKGSFEIERLTASELRRLNKMVLGYGNFKSTAISAGIHKETLRGIIHRGSGTPESIAKIRSVINEPASKIA